MISGVLFDLSKKNLLLCSEFWRPKPEICQTIIVPKSKCLSFLTLSLAIRSQWSLCILAFCTTTTARRSLLILANSNQNEKKIGIIFLRLAKYHVVIWRCLQSIYIIYLSESNNTNLCSTEVEHWPPTLATVVQFPADTSSFK